MNFPSSIVILPVKIMSVFVFSAISDVTQGLHGNYLVWHQTVDGRRIV